MKKKLIILAPLFAVAVIATYFLITRPKVLPLNVVATNPLNEARLVDTKVEIIITLNRGLTLEEGDLLKVKISPEERVETVYQEQRIRISPETEFKTGTEYEISVAFKEKEIYQLRFSTSSLTRQQMIEQGAKQTEADIAFAERYKSFLADYPWYRNLPIEKNEYRIIYDFEKESFRIRFKIPVQDSQKESVVKKALEDLKKIGVKEPISYYTLDYQP